MKKLIVILAMAVALAVMAVPALAWKEGPGTNWWYVDASYGGYHSSVPLVIEINGNPADGQTFNVGDTVTISGDLHAYAAMCAGTGNEALTDAALEVSGPSGSDSDTAGDYDFDDYECAEVDTIKTLTIAYPLIAPGTHTVYVYSYAEAASWWTGVDEDEFVEDSLTFEVVPAVIPVNIDIKPGSYPNCFNINGHGVIPVAILGSADFDVTQIDVSTLQFAGLDVRVKGNGNPQCSVEDVSGDFTSPEGAPDGHDDLVCQFVDDSAWSADDGTATLSGNLKAEYGGTPIEGSDEICLRPE